MSNKNILEETVKEFIKLSLCYEADRKPVGDFFREAMSDLLATREAQMIEAVEKLPQRALCDDESKTQTGFECAVYVPLGLVDAALRPQQQEEVSN